MEVRWILGSIGAAIALAALSIYLWSVVRGRTRPHPVSWLTWLMIGLLGLGGTVQGMAGAGALVPLAYLAGCLVMLCLSVTNRFGKTDHEKYDIWLVVGLAVLLAAWRVFQLPATIATGAAVVGDAIGAWPTVRGTWRMPSSESRPAWTLSAVAAGLSIASVEHFSFASTGYLGYLLVADLTVLAVMTVAKARRPSPESRASQA